MPPSRRRSARSIGEAGIAYGYYPRVHAELRSLGVRCAASEAGGPADAKSRAARVHAWKEEEDHPSRSSRCACSGPRQEELLCHSARQTLDGGHHLPLRTDEGFLHLAFSCWMSTRGGSSAGRWRSPPTHRELVVDALEMAVFGDVSRPQDSSTIPIAGLLSTRRFLSARGWRRLWHHTFDGKGGIGTGQRHLSESFVSTLKCELVHGRRFPTREAARSSAVFEYLEAFYNRRRLHSSLGYMSPENYEETMREGAAVA
jgi:transposase InsO family protein